MFDVARLAEKTTFNLIKIHLLFRIMILIQWSVNISVFVNHVVIVLWGPNEGDRKRTYIPRLFSEYNVLSKNVTRDVSQSEKTLFEVI
jgi:hypothetical protein